MISFAEFALLEEYDPYPGTQMGSNEGGMYSHRRTKKKYYIKFPKTEAQAKVEAATADIYKELGIRTVDPKVQVIHGKTAVVSPWNKDLKRYDSPDEIIADTKNVQRAKELAMIHHAAIITGNHDVVGLGYDNLLKDKHTGEIVSVDQGGAMHYRAQGAEKPFEKSIDEVHSFQNLQYPTGRIFHRLDPIHLHRAARDLHKLTDARIHELLKPHKLEYLGDVIKTRREMLIRHYRGTEEEK